MTIFWSVTGCLFGFNWMLMQSLNAASSLFGISDSNMLLCQSFLSLKSQKPLWDIAYCSLPHTHTHTRLSLHALSVSHMQPTVSSIFENKSLQPKVWEKQNKREGEALNRVCGCEWRLCSPAWFIIALLRLWGLEGLACARHHFNGFLGS